MYATNLISILYFFFVAAWMQNKYKKWPQLPDSGKIVGLGPVSAKCWNCFLGGHKLRIMQTVEQGFNTALPNSSRKLY